jgi:ATP-binding cassette subfamily F protein 3
MLRAMLRVEDLKKAFGARTLFSGVTYHFPEGERVALVGANGAGKTSFLNILCGLDPGDAGRVIAPSGVSVGYLPQKPNPEPKPTVLEECVAGATGLAAMREAMERALAAMAGGTSEPKALAAYEAAEAAYRLAGGYALEAKATTILRGLGFAPQTMAQDPRALSGGWRMRLELARLFIREPEFLVLDEPTNHLDLPSLVWVESYLRGFRGTLVFVSHDRALLNRLSTITLHLAGGKITPYRGNFDAFLEARDARLAQEQATLSQLKRRREAMESFVERFGAKATKAAQAQSRVKMIARIREVEEGFDSDAAEDPAGVYIALPPPPKTPRVVLEIDDGAIGYDRTLAAGIKLSLERGAKVAVIGANGIGKSTLLRTVSGRLARRGGSFALADGVEASYFAQDQNETLDLADTLLSNLVKRSTLSEKEARSLLGSFLFRGDDVFKPARVLSGGELSRLGLACALARRAGLLLLDEPTNHLDMGSVESLAAALSDYEGTVLMVSHDRTFIDGVATHVFAMLPDGRSMLFEGQLADYERLAALAGFPNVLAVDDDKNQERAAAGKAANGAGTSGAQSAPSGGSHQEAKELKRQRQKLETRTEQLDQEMAKLRRELDGVESAMGALGGGDYQKAAALHADQERLRAALDAAEGAWLEASEALEAVTAQLTSLGRS